MCVSSRKNRRSSNNVQISMDNTCMLHDWSSSMLFQDQGWISGLRVSRPWHRAQELKPAVDEYSATTLYKKGWVGTNEPLCNSSFWCLRSTFTTDFRNLESVWISHHYSKETPGRFPIQPCADLGKASYLCSAKLRHWPKCECPDPTLAIFQFVRSPEPRIENQPSYGVTQRLVPKKY